MAGGEALWHVRVTLLLLGLEVSLFLSAWSLDEHSQHQSPPEVVIPLKVSGTGKSVKASGWLSYSLHFGGQRHIVHMKVKKSFLARNLPVFTYTEQGALLDDQPFIPSDCYYHGYVEGDPESLVVLSTCFGGFQGILQVKDITYEIRPKMFSATFEHLVYKMDSEETQFPPMRCGLTEEEIERQLKLQGIHNYTLMQSAYEGWWTHHWTLELAMIVDHNRYITLRSNETNVQQEVFNVLNLVGSFYVPMGVEIFLRGIEIWTNENILTNDSIYALLTEFCSWKQKSGLKDRIHHDVVHIAADKSFGIYLGLTYVGVICIPRYNCAVLKFSGDDLSSLAVIMAHELGHNLGMAHDNRYCKCVEQDCIMYAGKTSSSSFSNCSYSGFWDMAITTTCMRNRINPPVLGMERLCGNNVVESGEACDCGTFKSCEKDPCCLLNCNLTPGAICAFGGCCQNCNFMPSGTLCRAEVNECDLPEWCDGSTYQCREDVYVQDWTPCLGNGYCYEKNCVNRDEQCRKIFGKEAKSANTNCYEEINTRGDRFGHCAMNEYEYKKCSISDSLCGRIQCENISEIPLLKQHSTVHTAYFDGVTCWGTDYHFGMTIPDIGIVKDGTECGPENICIRSKCVNVQHPVTNCTRDACNNMGVCNNKRHCHCVAGKAPPNCFLNGSGGSIDSGPMPGPNKEMVKKMILFSLFSIISLLALYLLIFLCMRPKEE